MSIYKYLIWIALSIPFQGMAEDSTANSTRFSATAQSETEMQLAKSWDLTLEDWSAYKTIMQGPRGIWTPNLDPITVLGINAKTDKERDKYARKLVEVERKRVERELAFEMAYQKIQAELYGDVPLYRHNKKPTSGYGEVKQVKSVDLFLQLPCKTCTAKVRELIDAKIPLTMYFLGVDEAAIKAWALSVSITPALVRNKQVTLNFDNGLAAERGITTFPYMVEKQ